MSKTKKPFVNFQKIKTEVPIELVLKDHGVDWLKRKGDNLVGRCPFHEQAEGQTAFQASVSKNIYHCFSCQRKGNVIDLEAEFENIEFKEAARRLADRYLAHADQTVKKISVPVKAETKQKELEENKPLKFQLKLDRDHPYLLDKGFTMETIEIFDCGYCSRGLLQNRIAFSIHDENGVLIGYAGRGLTGLFTEETPKYKFPPGFIKEVVVYNLQRARSFIEQTKTVIVVEGFNACLWLWQSGYKNVVALMGSALCAGQQKPLEELKANVILLFDGDKAGREGTETAVLALSKKLFVRSIDVGDNRQPDHLTKGELVKILT